MDTNGTNVATAFEELGDLEKEFAQVELDARKSNSAGAPC